MDKERHYDVQSSGWTRKGIIMGGHYEGGLYDVQIKWWFSKGGIIMCK